MAWTTPPTFVSGNVLTAAQLNVLSGDLNASIVGQSTLTYDAPDPSFGITQNYRALRSPGLGVATGANAVTARQPVSSSELFQGTTTATTATATLTALAGGTTVGPSVTVTGGTTALVLMTGTVQNDTNGKASTITFGINGSTGAQNWISLLTAAASQQLTASAFTLQTGLTAGSNTFTMQYAVGSLSTGYFQRRYLTVIPF